MSALGMTGLTAYFGLLEVRLLVGIDAGQPLGAGWEGAALVEPVVSRCSVVGASGRETQGW